MIIVHPSCTIITPFEKGIPWASRVQSLFHSCVSTSFSNHRHCSIAASVLFIFLASDFRPLGGKDKTLLNGHANARKRHSCLDNLYNKWLAPTHIAVHTSYRQWISEECSVNVCEFTNFKKTFLSLEFVICMQYMCECVCIYLFFSFFYTKGWIFPTFVFLRLSQKLFSMCTSVEW